jgi:hydrogenase maturation protease
MPKTLVLGLGNPLVSDEGFVVQAVRHLQERYRFPDDVEVVDGGTLGLKLLPILEDADRIIILDAVDVSRSPGTVVLIGWEDVHRALPVKISPHQETVTEVLALLELRRGRPNEFLIVGCQPALLKMGLELSAEVGGGLEKALGDVVTVLKDWGHAVVAADRVAP